tara:strand:+ start:54 stop:347 length:294 start_codon:yes stop_codon:yes gene_type:complete
MSKISKEQVKKVAKLARLQLNDEQIGHHSEQLEKILKYIDQLEKINTDNVPCTTRAIEVVNVLRNDINHKFEENESILDLAPSREENFFKVPKIIKD